MTEVAAVLDWSTARSTQAVLNVAEKPKKSGPPTDGSVCVLRVPRARFAELCQLSWAELEARAARGEDEIEPWRVLMIDLPATNTAYMREGLRSDGFLLGRSLLFRQGWDALS